MHSNTLIRLFCPMVLNRTGPSIDPWGTPLVTGLQLDFMLLITSLRARPFSHFLVHLIDAYAAPTSIASL